MLKRPARKQLTLNRETLRVLADKELQQAAGGGTDTCNEVCTTQKQKAQNGGG